MTLLVHDASRARKRGRGTSRPSVVGTHSLLVGNRGERKGEKRKKRGGGEPRVLL